MGAGDLPLGKTNLTCPASVLEIRAQEELSCPCPHCLVPHIFISITHGHLFSNVKRSGLRLVESSTKAAVLQSCFTYHIRKKAAKHHLTYAHSTSTCCSFWMRIPSDLGGDARVQAEKCKGNTARQGLPSLLAKSHCYTTRPGEAVSHAEMESNSDSAKLGFGSQKSFFFPFICKALTSAGWYPRRPCLMRSRCWHKPSRLPTPTALGGDAAKLSCRLAEWVFFGTPGPFLKAVAPPEWWEGSLSREITQGVDRCVGVLPALGRQGREAAPYQQPEGPGGAKNGVAELCSKIYTTEPTSKHNRKRKASFSLLGNGLVQPVA